MSCFREDMAEKHTSCRPKNPVRTFASLLLGRKGTGQPALTVPTHGHLGCQY